jgi:hypothetical protein
MTEKAKAPAGYELASGPAYSRLGNAVSSAIYAAISDGMEVDEACSVAIGVVGDYWRARYPLDEAAIAGLSGCLKASDSFDA